MPNNPITYYRRKEAAQYLQERYGFPCSQAWLASLASKGGGPLFQKAGRYPLYSESNLNTWAKKRISTPYETTKQLVKKGEQA